MENTIFTNPDSSISSCNATQASGCTRLQQRNSTIPSLLHNPLTTLVPIPTNKPVMMQSATSRLRHTFKYPSEDTSANTSRDELDEEQQESLLTSLSTTATKNDNLYRLIFTVLPLASMLPLIRNFFISPGREYVFPGVLGVTSLGITGWDMWRCSVGGEDALGRQGKRPSNIFVAAGGSSAAAAVRGEGPLLKYLPYLNGTIAVLLLVLSFVFARREEGNGGEGFWLLLLLPAVNLGVVTVVKRSMVEVERGLGELRGLRYEYKGA